MGSITREHSDYINRIATGDAAVYYINAAIERIKRKEDDTFHTDYKTQ